MYPGHAGLACERLFRISQMEVGVSEVLPAEVLCSSGSQT